MANVRAFTSSRTTEPDEATLLANLRALDASASVRHVELSGTWDFNKSTPWLAGQITAAQNVLDTCPFVTGQSLAQAEIDRWPIALRALVLTLIDQLNVLRAFHSLPAVTPAQALAAVRTKAGTL